MRPSLLLWSRPSHVLALRLAPLLLAVFGVGCQSTVSLLQTPTKTADAYATLTMEGMATGGYFRLFDEGPVLDGDTVVPPRFIVVPGDPTRLQVTRSAPECEYLAVDIDGKHGESWIAHELTLAAPGNRQDYLRQLVQAIRYVPEDGWGNVTNAKTIWTYSPRGDGYTPAPPSSTDRVRVVGSWHYHLVSLEPNAPTNLVSPDEDQIHYERKPVAASETTPVEFERLFYSIGSPGQVYWRLFFTDALGSLEYPFVRCSPRGRPEIGRLFIDRPLTGDQCIALADAWVRQHSFIATEMSPVGLLASKDLTWHRPPGKSRLVLLVSVGWERGATVVYARSREFEFEAGRHYRFRLRKQVEGMVGNLLIESVPSSTRH
ncbi:MAG: hypothetical protein JNK85_04410 [Verrucomicrobiales bacterium]|nr:hypothetical protein [Verrucomicrobiales bacterium]